MTLNIFPVGSPGSICFFGSLVLYQYYNILDIMHANYLLFADFPTSLSRFFPLFFFSGSEGICFGDEVASGSTDLSKVGFGDEENGDSKWKKCNKVN